VSYDSDKTIPQLDLAASVDDDLLLIGRPDGATRDSAFSRATLLDGVARSADLATVATTGAYADLSGTPLIQPMSAPTDLGALGYTETIDLGVAAELMGSVGSAASTELEWTAPSPGARVSLLLTATADCSVSIPSGWWLFGSVWDGAMADGDQVRLSIYYDGARYEYAWATLSQTDVAVTIDASQVSYTIDGAEIITASSVQGAIDTLDAALYAARSRSTDFGDVSSSLHLDFSEYDRISVTLVGDAAVTLTPPDQPRSCVLYTTQDATGGYTPMWPTMHWEGGELPTLDTGPGVAASYRLDWNGSAWLASGRSYGSVLAANASMSIAVSGELPNKYPVNLTDLGTLDWVMFGRTAATDRDEKATGSGIGALTAEVPPLGWQVANEWRPYLSWTDGTPTATGTDLTTAVLTDSSGWTLSVDADATERTLSLVLSAYKQFVPADAITITGVLSDASADSVSATISMFTTVEERIVSITYRAATTTQLVITATSLDETRIRLHGAYLR